MIENLKEKNSSDEKNNSHDGCLLNLKLFNVYYFILFLISITVNLVVIYIILKNRKKFLHHVNILTLALAVLNFIGILVEILVAIVESASKCNNK